MHQLKKFIKTIFIVLRPLEIMGLFFFIVMVVLYRYFGLGFYPKALTIWMLLIFLTYLTILCIRLFLSKGDLRKVFSIKKVLHFIRDWIPLFLFIWVYDNLHDIVRLMNPYNFDQFFITVDKILFLGHHPTTIFEKVVSPIATEWFGLCYALYFLYFPLTLGVMYMLKDKKAFHITSFSVMLTIYVGYIGYLLFPCVGPILAQHHLHTVPLQGDGAFAWYQGVVEIYGSYRDYFHCFPSLHFAVTAVFWFFTWKYVRWLFYIYAPMILSLWFSTMYLRWHYVVDILAGAVLAGYAIFFGPMIYDAWEKWKKKQARKKKTRS